MSLRTLLHISDVHFGPPHLPRVSQGVLELVAEKKPSLVVVSGDLTQRAREEQFKEARSFVDAIERLGVPTLVVPGNHDVPLWRFWERLFDPYGAYRRWFSPELEPVHRDDALLAVGINTAFGWTTKEGRITLARLRQVEEIFRATPESVFKVVVAHHHLIPPPNFGTQRVLGNAFEAIDLFSRAGVDLILSGHQHQAYIGSSEEFYPAGRPPVVILHSGTTTSNRGRAGERERNTCNWIGVERDSMLVCHLRWQRDTERFAEQSRHWYPRQERVPYSLEGLMPPAV